MTALGFVVGCAVAAYVVFSNMGAEARAVVIGVVVGGVVILPFVLLGFWMVRRQRPRSEPSIQARPMMGHPPPYQVLPPGYPPYGMPQYGPMPHQLPAPRIQRQDVQQGPGFTMSGNIQD